MKSKKISQNYFLIILLGLTLLLLIPSSAMAYKSVYGYLEPVKLQPNQVLLIAKLDTGAETSSISAKDIHLYEKEGKEYVKFEVSHPKIEQAIHYDLPLVRHAKIKMRKNEIVTSKEYHSRPVVYMQIYFDDRPYKIKVNLIDRSHFSTPMLLGRKALEKLGAVVDSTTKNTLLKKTGKHG